MKDFDQIYKENYRMMYCIAQKMIYDKDAASDIVQEVFIYFFNKINEKYTIQYPKSWLYRATLNKCIDYQKQRSKFTDIKSITDTATDDDTENEDAKLAVKKALNTLTDKEKMIAVLYSEGLSYKEIAEVIAMNFTSVGKTLSRTLKKIEKELKKQQYEVFE